MVTSAAWGRMESHERRRPLQTPQLRPSPLLIRPSLLLSRSEISRYNTVGRMRAAGTSSSRRCGIASPHQSVSCKTTRHVLPLPTLKQQRTVACVVSDPDSSEGGASTSRGSSPASRKTLPITHSWDEEEYAPNSLEARIQAGTYGDVGGSTKEQLLRPVRKALAESPLGRGIAYQLARLGRAWVGDAQKKIPTAMGDIREIVDKPVFKILFSLFKVYGKIFKLSFGPKNFVIISDNKYAKQILMTNADKYSKGILSEILEFVMGQGLIPADGAVWKARRRTIVPALHRKYVSSMVGMFGDCAANGCTTLDKAVASGTPVEMENFFSRLSLDIIGKAVFNYEFNSLANDDPVIMAVYTVLREAEHRSTAPIQYWNFPGAKTLIPRQKACVEALQVVNNKLNILIAESKRVWDEGDEVFGEDFLSNKDPSILHFLLAQGEEVSSKQLRDDLMTMLVAGHETTAAVLTWTMHLLAQHPDVTRRVQEEVDRVIGDRLPTIEDIMELKFTTRVINESMRLYPQPPVLIRRALEDDTFDQYTITKGSDIFISVWNLHRSADLWKNPDDFNPDRFPTDLPIPNEITEEFAYLPFGGGRRKCIGDQFALFESVVGLSTIMRRYAFTMAPGAPPVGMTTGATIHTSEGLLMNLTHRGAPPSNGMAHASLLGCPAGCHAAPISTS
ncbi:hypothetical protein FOA52_010102 [Chlamydomonas sp. UWO 241]|nr:hypothetical protein FOA52_010102 [Chlamydomonas sp. UWO 241]